MTDTANHASAGIVIAVAVAPVAAMIVVGLVVARRDELKRNPKEAP